MNMSNKQTGFTLIEMMIVVAIMAIMSAMLAPTLFNQVSKAEKARTASDIRQIESALKFYRLDNYRYPTQSQGLQALITAPSGSEATSWNGPYLETVSRKTLGNKTTDTQIRVLMARRWRSIPSVPTIPKVVQIPMQIGVAGMSMNEALMV